MKTGKWSIQKLIYTAMLGSGCWRADVIGIFGSDDAAVL